MSDGACDRHEDCLMSGSTDGLCDLLECRLALSRRQAFY